MQGSYYVLSALPIWATAILLYTVTMGVLFVLRDRREGLYYNTSYSAVLGDGALMVVVVMGAEILKRGVSLPGWTQGGLFHELVAGSSLILGVTWWELDRPKQWADRFHHLVIAPILCYALVTLAPVIFGRGTKVEIVATLCMVGIWAAMVVYDVKTKRLDQRQYRALGEHLDAIKKMVDR